MPAVIALRKLQGPGQPGEPLMLIAHITDLHLRTEGEMAFNGHVDTAARLAQAVDFLNGFKPAPDLVLVTGDLVDFGKPEEYANLRRVLDRLQAPAYLIPGNHDNRENLRRAYADHAYLPKAGFLHYVVEGHPVLSCPRIFWTPICPTGGIHDEVEHDPNRNHRCE